MLALLAKYYYNYELALLVSAVIFVRLFTFWYATLFGVITGLITYRGYLTLNHSGQIGRLTRNKLTRYKKELGN